MKKIKCMNKTCNKLTTFQSKELFSFCAKDRIAYKKVLKETNTWIKENPEQVKEIMNQTTQDTMKQYEIEKEIIQQKKEAN